MTVPPERDLALTDLGQLLEAVGLGDHARPQPPEAFQEALAAVREMRARITAYENAITWNTSCLACATVLDSCIRETERAERAEEALAGATAAGATEALLSLAAEIEARAADPADRWAAELARQRAHDSGTEATGTSPVPQEGQSGSDGTEAHTGAQCARWD